MLKFEFQSNDLGLRYENLLFHFLEEEEEFLIFFWKKKNLYKID